MKKGRGKLHPTRQLALLSFLCLILLNPSNYAQDIEPRIMTAAPIGSNLYGLTALHSWGNVLADKTLQIDDLDGYTSILALSFSRYINIFNKTARFDAVLPFATGEWDAYLGGSETETSVSSSGLADPKLTLSIFLLGAEAMDLEQFGNYKKETVAALIFRVSLPLGAYNPDQLLNLGSNRWQFILGAGLSHRMGNWTAELLTGVWFFTDNKNFRGGNVLEQDPLLAVQADIAYDFKPGTWISLGVRQTAGGDNTLNGIDKANPMENTRIGLVAGIPVSQHHTIKLIATSGLFATKGTNYHTLGAQWFIF